MQDRVVEARSKIDAVPFARCRLRREAEARLTKRKAPGCFPLRGGSREAPAGADRWIPASTSHRRPPHSRTPPHARACSVHRRPARYNSKRNQGLMYLTRGNFVEKFPSVCPSAPSDQLKTENALRAEKVSCWNRLTPVSQWHAGALAEWAEGGFVGFQNVGYRGLDTIPSYHTGCLCICGLSVRCLVVVF